MSLGPLGAHVSTSGGVSAALPRARTIAATAMQIFTKTANQWKEPAIEETERAAFRSGLAASDIVVSNARSEERRVGKECRL